MLVIAGLGNPGGKYAGTRHNIGFMAVDAIGRHYGFDAWQSKYQADFVRGRIDSSHIDSSHIDLGIDSGEAVLVKPKSFMNRSGAPLGSLMRFYKWAVADLIVVHDDIDLPPGKVRVKRGGGHGGHNGLRDIDRHLGADYRRIRIGIGRGARAAQENGPVERHVLGDFGTEEMALWVAPLLDAIARELPRVFNDERGFATAVAGACPPPPQVPN